MAARFVSLLSLQVFWVGVECRVQGFEFNSYDYVRTTLVKGPCLQGSFPVRRGS